jgi:hypothetical protein
MSKYNTIVRQQEKLKNSTQKTLQVSRNDKKLIDIDEVIKLTTGLQGIGDSQDKNTSLLIRGESIAGWTTIKGFDEDLKSIDDYLEYYSNRVKSTGKFNGFYQLQVTIISYDKKVEARKDLDHYKVKHPEEKAEKKVSKSIFGKQKAEK